MGWLSCEGDKLHNLGVLSSPEPQQCRSMVAQRHVGMSVGTVVGASVGTDVGMSVGTEVGTGVSLQRYS